MKNNNINIKVKTTKLEQIPLIKDYLNCSYLTATILSHRLHDFSYDNINNFINPSLKNNWITPSNITNIEAFCIKIKEIIKQQKTIGIIGDYDVDGLTSTAMMMSFFKTFNTPIVTWIPSRNNGYGPNEDAANFFNQQNITTVITLDCGTTAFEFAEHFNGEIIVLDHHPASKTIKGIIINPNATETKNQTLKELSAAGLIFLSLSYVLKDIYPENYRTILNSYIDLVALSTICDMMPLNPLNKALIRKGLTQLSEQKRMGLSHLINLANIKLPITARDIAFSIGPRLNAAGRIESPQLSLDLLLADTPETTSIIAHKLERTNNYRREIQKQIFEEAIPEARKSHEKIICLSNQNWNLGVVGIVAAMIQNEINKPTLIANINNKIVKGSARSNTLNIGMLIEKAVELKMLESGGGHKNAAGFVCHIGNWPRFKEWINAQTFDNVVETINIDAITTLSEINPDYKILAPFGIGNPNPLILVENLIVAKILDKISYLHIVLQENFKPYTFFVEKTATKIIENIYHAYKNKIKVTCIIELNEKKYTIKEAY